MFAKTLASSVFIGCFMDCCSLLPSQPFRHSARVKADACSDAERRDAPCLRLFENRDSQDGQHVREFVSRKNMSSRFWRRNGSERTPPSCSAPLAVNIQLRDCRQRLSSRNARSSWFRQCPYRLAKKAVSTYGTIEPTRTPSGQPNPPKAALSERPY